MTSFMAHWPSSHAVLSTLLGPLRPPSLAPNHTYLLFESYITSQLAWASDSSQQWLSTVMHHSGLFTKWHTKTLTRMTAVPLDPTDTDPVILHLYPHGPLGKPAQVVMTPGTVVEFDS